MINRKKQLKQFLFLGSCFLSLIVSGQSLQEYVNIAEKNNPEIQKFELQYKVASEKINEANTLPNTEIGVGVFVSEPETRTGAQQLKFSAKQMIPWFGSIAARENYVSSLANAKFQDIVIAKRKLIVAVTQSYYELYAIQRRIEVLSSQITLLETHKKLALNAVEVGETSAVSVLKLQIRQNELSQIKRILAHEFLGEQTHFNKLLNRDKNVPIKIAYKMEIPLSTLNHGKEKLELHPELIKFDKLYESVTKSDLLNQKERSPMFGIGVDYIAVSKRSNMDFVDNGKDIVMPMFTLSIPIFNKKYKSRSKQFQLEKQVISFQKKDRLNTLEIMLEQAIHKRISARITYETQVKNIQQAAEAEQLLMRSYETGVIDFNEILDMQELQLKLQLNQIAALNAYFNQATIVNYLTN